VGIAVGNKGKMKRAVMAAAFLIIGALLFFVMQEVFTPEWGVFPDDVGNLTAYLDNFYSLPENSVQAAFIGASHVREGVSPMVIYNRSGVTSINLGNASQTKSQSLFFLRELFKTQSPKVVIFDVSALFADYSLEKEASYSWVLDSVPMSANKLELIFDYAEYKRETAEKGSENAAERQAFLRCMFPMYQYHERWDQLTVRDFNFAEIEYPYLFGFSMINTVIPSYATVEVMNSVADMMNAETELFSKSYTAGKFAAFETHTEPLYFAQITEENKEFLREFLQICQAHDCALLTIKIPAVILPFLHGSAWTRERSEAVRAAASEVGVDYLDLLYDADLGLDWNRDTDDGGMHLNTYGAEKVSAFMGDYLTEHYDLQPIKSEIYENARERYQKATVMGRLQVETSLPKYLDILAENADHLVICMAASDDMRNGLNEADIAGLQTLGLQTDFGGMNYQDSFVAVIDGGQVQYEAVSNRRQDYATVLSDGTRVSLTSAGAWSGRVGSLQIGDTVFTSDWLGLGFLIYDKESQQPIDRAIFNTYLPEHTVSRNNPEKFGWYENYKIYLWSH